MRFHYIPGARDEFSGIALPDMKAVWSDEQSAERDTKTKEERITCVTHDVRNCLVHDTTRCCAIIHY